ncbi:hypothetical protein SAY87_031253 [Trapa incisa]|uniref:Uncharacterized protein n=1 Tax=Trapa incisa TaxID=236973 RepID=A0AAN7KWR0_9MYRT|nr:hypothetical protein SAY87_031253 [Trapa incisa]
MASNAAAHPSSSSSSVADSYIGSFISLISRYEIRYEGTLYSLNVKDSTIGLKNVKSCGTEGRRKDGPQIPPTEKVYDYILFRGSDIKDLQVKSSPPAKAEESPYSDPAIIQTHYAGVQFASPPVAVSGKSHFQDTPAVITRENTEEAHPYWSGMFLSSSNQAQSSQSHVAPDFSTPIFSQIHNRTAISHIDGISHSTSSMSHPSVLIPRTLQNQVQLNAPQTSATDVLISTSEGIIPVPSSIASFIKHPIFPPQIPMQHFNSPVISSPDVNLPLSAHSPLIPFNSVAMPPMTNSKPVSDHSMTYPSGSFRRPISYSPLTQPQSFLAPTQLAQPGYSHMQKLNPISDVDYAISAQAGVLSSNSSEAPRDQLLPSSTSAHQKNFSAPFTEEFDFEAMNEKFKKDEVWGALGKLDKKGMVETDVSSATLRIGGRESNELGLKSNPKAAYKKDDFFDTISCNSTSQGTRIGHNRFSERMKMDDETFGNPRFRQPHQNYGVYGAGQHGWGRRYDYGGRGNGGNMP